MEKKYKSTHEQCKMNHRINENGIIERKCTVCEEWKIEEDNFYFSNNRYKAECKICSSKQARARALKNPERAKQSTEQWQKDNIIRYRQVRKEYNQNNKEKIYQYSTNWQKENPDKIKGYNKQHRQHDITEQEWTACKQFFNYQCAYCGLPMEEHIIKRKNKNINLDFHKEHVDDEGYNDIRNCVPSCQNCNSTKSTKTIDEFLEFTLVKEFTKDKYNKIIQWITDEYKKHIENKPPYRIIRKQNDDKKTYHFELWTVDKKRDIIKCVGIRSKKRELTKLIKKHFKI